MTTLCYVYVCICMYPWIHASCYGYTCNYNPITVISISLSCLIDVQKSRTSMLIEFPNLLCASNMRY